MVFRHAPIPRKGSGKQQQHLVLVVNEAVPRSQWSIARVIETYPDARGDVRSVMVKTPHSILKRPISKLCLIESAHAD